MTHNAEDDLQRLLAEEPFLRALAQQLVVEDADELVQQTYLSALQQGSCSVVRPRHWLARIARNVAINRGLADSRRRHREHAVAVSELVPSAAELAEREERRRALVAAIDSLPPALRTIVLLRWFDGHPPRRIAAALGLSTATVSTQLHRALQRLRRQLDAAHSNDRRAWLLPLVPYVVRPTPPPLLESLAFPPLFAGVITMSTKTKLIATTTIFLLLASTWMLWPSDGLPVERPTLAGDSAPPSLVRAQLDEPSRAMSPEAGTVEREAATSPDRTETTGTLIVHLRYGDDHTPAIGHVLTLQKPAGDHRYDGLRQRTDGTGTVRYESLLPSRLYITDHKSPGKAVEIAAGELTELYLDLEVGILVTGIVVDDAHAPIAGAQVEIAMMASADTFPEIVALTGADGRFSARASPTACLVGARAAGYTASTVRFPYGKTGNSAEVELVLGRHGGSVEGLVVDARGEPVANTVVIIGAGELSGIAGQEHIPPFAALTRSDDKGRFHAIGIPAGKQPVQARVPGFAPWQGECEVAADSTISLRIALETGAVIRGRVVNSLGEAVNHAQVEIGRMDDLAHFRARTAADGTFEFKGLPIGELSLRADYEQFGKAEYLVLTRVDSPSSCELKLSRGFELKGFVVDSDSQPVANVRLECMSERARDNSWFRFAHTDSQGRFAATNCPETESISIIIRARGFEELWKRGIDPKAGMVELQLQRVAPSTVRIVGNVVGPDGRPIANARVSVRRKGVRTSQGAEVTGNDGRIELGPYPPGIWQVFVWTRDYPEFRTEPRELSPESTWDLGVVTLTIGGTAVLRQVGTALEGARFIATNATRTQSWGFDDSGGRLRSSVLATGDYFLLVSGRGIAAQAVPFTIRAEEQTTVDMQPLAGSSQQFSCELPPETEYSGAWLEILHGTKYCGRVWASKGSGQRLSAEAWLTPGDYTVTAKAGELRGKTRFAASSISGPPVRITLR